MTYLLFQFLFCVLDLNSFLVFLFLFPFYFISFKRHMSFKRYIIFFIRDFVVLISILIFLFTYILINIGKEMSLPGSIVIFSKTAFYIIVLNSPEWAQQD